MIFADSPQETKYGLRVFGRNANRESPPWIRDVKIEEAAELQTLVRSNTSIPLGALSLAYPVGVYPFGPMDKVSERTIDPAGAERGFWGLRRSRSMRSMGSTSSLPLLTLECLLHCGVWRPRAQRLRLGCGRGVGKLSR